MAETERHLQLQLQTHRRTTHTTITIQAQTILPITVTSSSCVSFNSEQLVATSFAENSYTVDDKNLTRHGRGFREHFLN